MEREGRTDGLDFSTLEILPPSSTWTATQLALLPTARRKKLLPPAIYHRPTSSADAAAQRQATQAGPGRAIRARPPSLQTTRPHPTFFFLLFPRPVPFSRTRLHFYFCRRNSVSDVCLQIFLINGMLIHLLIRPLTIAHLSFPDSSVSGPGALIYILPLSYTRAEAYNWKGCITSRPIRIETITPFRETAATSLISDLCLA